MLFYVLCPVTSDALVWGISESPGVLVRNADSWVSPMGNSESAG